jgi:PAS domain S-box-containing protein
MGFSQEHKATTHTRLLRLASRYLKRQGPERLAVAKLMHAAGLTHGSFYTHFTSKEALLLGALEGAFNDAEQIYRRLGDNLPPGYALTRFIDFYLSTYHRDSPSNCPIVTLSSDLPRQSRKFRATFNAGLKRLLGILAGWMEAAGISDSETVAAATLSAMAGTMAVARAVSDKRVSEDLLAVASDNLKAQLGLGDLATVVKVSQALTREIDLGKLIDTLMGLALEHAGADRGLLILPRGDELRIEAEAKTVRGTIDVRFRQTRVAPGELPESVLRYVIQTQDSVLLDDAAGQSPYSGDEYIRQNQCRSIFCLPLTRLGNLVGVLYLENNLTRHVFTSARIAVLKLLASQAAIALQNARLYRDLAEREAKIRRLVDANIIGVIIADLDGPIIEANDAFLEMLGYSRDDLVAGRLRWIALTPADWHAATQRAIAQIRTTGRCDTYEQEYIRKDGSRVPALVGGAAFEDTRSQSVSFILDLSERKRAEEGLQRAHAELAHVTRVMTLGELTASIAHEVTQPLAAIVTNGDACLRLLSSDGPNLDKTREAVASIIRDARRAAEIVTRTRALLKKSDVERTPLDLGQVIRDVLALVQSEMARHRIVLRTSLAHDLPPVLGDRIQLQQVVLNLLTNAIQAMRDVADRRRELMVSAHRHEVGAGVRVAVEDTGVGFEQANVECLFQALYTTKPDGLGMGLSISRSIILSHGGRLGATPNAGYGATFQFVLPAWKGQRP